MQFKILTGYVILMAVIGSMAAILMHEHKRIREIEAGTETIRQVRRDISDAHRRITRLALLGEGKPAGTKRTAAITMPNSCAPTACCKP